MKRQSIVVKIFLIIALVFSIFVVVQVGFQSLFLGKYYESVKVKNLEKDMDQFIEEYLSTTKAMERSKLLSKYIQQSGSHMEVTYDNGFPDYSTEYLTQPYYIGFKAQNGEFFRFPLSALGDKLIEVYDYDDLTGKPATIGFELDEESGMYYIIYIIIDGVRYEEEYLVFSLDEEGEVLFDSGISEITDLQEQAGEIAYFEDNVMYYNISPKKSILDFEIMKGEEILRNMVDNEYAYDFEDPENDARYKIIIKKRIDEYGEILYFYTLVSLQPVNEVVQVLMNFSVYFVIIALILVVAISLLISRMITKPLIKLKNVAVKMANLDFTEKYNVKRNDELGSLGESLNFMSDELGKNIDELKEANRKLEADIEFERRQEKIRKEFVSNVSHELKTPLGIIKSFAEGIQDGISEDKKGYYLDVIIDEISKMNTLIVDMLELTNLEAKINKLHKEKFNLREVCDKLILRFDEIKESKEIQFNYHVEDGIVDADLKKIGHVLSNLISNSFRYTEKGGTINLYVEKGWDGVRFRIENTADPFSDEALEKIWDRFYRVEKSRSRSLGGNGLGLSIVKSILENHESDFGVRNTEIGVEFYFILKN